MWNRLTSQQPTQSDCAESPTAETESMAVPRWETQSATRWSSQWGQRPATSGEDLSLTSSLHRLVQCCQWTLSHCDFRGFETVKFKMGSLMSLRLTSTPPLLLQQHVVQMRSLHGTEKCWKPTRRTRTSVLLERWSAAQLLWMHSVTCIQNKQNAQMTVGTVGEQSAKCEVQMWI